MGTASRLGKDVTGQDGFPVQHRLLGAEPLEEWGKVPFKLKSAKTSHSFLLL